MEKTARLETAIMSLDNLTPNKDNPRVDLQPGDPDYESIKKSIAEFDYLQPIVWNKRSNQIVGGHQRVKILRELGYSHAEVRVVDMDAQQETAANLALNKVGGRWDMPKLSVVLNTLDIEHKALTGFADHEIPIDLDNIGERPERIKLEAVNWRDFKIFHAGLDDTCYVIDELRYLVPFHLLEKRDPGRSKDKCELFIDSGLLGMSKVEGAKALENQGRVIETAKRCNADYAAALDVPLIHEVLDPLGISKERAYDIHMQNVEDFSKETVQFKKVYVVQGFEPHEYTRYAEAMKPYIKDDDMIAIGSIKNRSKETDLLVDITNRVKSVFPNNDLHLFGITRPEAVAACSLVGATSCDSSSASLSRAFGNMLFPAIKNNECSVSSKEFSEVTGIENLSISGALKMGITAYNMGALETAIRLAIRRAQDAN